MSTTLTQRITTDVAVAADFTLRLTAEERTRSRHRFTTDEGEIVQLQLPRGTVLQDGDLLRSDMDERVVRVVAKLEPVLTASASSPLGLLQAAYHLGNRHVPLEITSTYLRLAPDPVLKDLLEHRGLQVVEEMQPFEPETGAYGSGNHSH